MGKRSYAVSDITKHAMAASLKRLMEKKRVDKITIQEIMDGCGMKRQNFYYHFQDIYDLMDWMFYEEAISLLQRHEGALLWQDGLLQLFQYLEENRAVCLCALRSVGREHLKQFFLDDIDGIIRHTFDNLVQELDCTREELDARRCARFFTIALAALVEGWLLGDIQGTPEEIIAFVDTLLRDWLNGAALRVCPPGGTDRTKLQDDQSIQNTERTEITKERKTRP